jgi:biopolymer transport protein TolR
MGAGVIQGSDGGRRRGRRRSRARPMSEINVTPFVDVMLVLLIVFMVAAPLLTVGVPINLPETAANPLPTEREDPLTVTMTVEGGLLIQTEAVAADQLIPRLSAIAKERTSQKIYLRADGDIAYARVAEVMGALNSAGFNEIGLVTDAAGPRFDGNGG